MHNFLSKALGALKKTAVAVGAVVVLIGSLWLAGAIYDYARGISVIEPRAIRRGEAVEFVREVQYRVDEESPLGPEYFEKSVRSVAADTPSSVEADAVVEQDGQSVNGSLIQIWGKARVRIAVGRDAEPGRHKIVLRFPNGAKLEKEIEVVPAK